MIVGIGIDIIDIQRIVKVVEEKPKMLNKLLTQNEQKRYQGLSSKRQGEFLAGRFACKEAFSKAYGTGIGSKVGWLDVEILSNKSGAPEVTRSPFKGNVFVSISHTDSTAVAQIVLEQFED